MKIQKNQVVSIAYELSVQNDESEFELIENVDAQQPYTFIYGASGLPAAFEDNIASLAEGDTFEFSLTPEQGYGEYDEEAVVEVEKDVFESDEVGMEELLQIGNIIPMSNDEGHTLQGQVVDITDEFVLMDFNHPLSGVGLHFKGAILSVRPATDEELQYGLAPMDEDDEEA
jgi:FKBP-type peptidyl-prolyl cis-trans isomerase SlyD